MFENAIPEKIAWVAGIFEGEGTINAQKHQNSEMILPRIEISSTDLDVLEDVKQLVGCGSIFQYSDERKATYKIAYKFSFTRVGDTLEFIEEIYVWLHSRRKIQADAVLDQYYSQRLKECAECGNTFWSENNTKTCSELCSKRRHYRLQKLRDKRYGTKPLGVKEPRKRRGSR